MDKIWQFLFLTISLHQIFHLIDADELMQHKFTSKCDDLCIDRNRNTTKELVQVECLRGCQYFNIEFLMNARKEDINGKDLDLNQLLERCGITCLEAYYLDKTKKEHCFHGCNMMMDVQAKAPFINGWYVYMGASDRNLVLMQPELDIPAKDWVKLNTVALNDYEYSALYGTYDEVSPQYEVMKRYIDRANRYNCFPMWIWILPFFSVAVLIYMYYSQYIYGIFVNESLHLISPAQVNGVPINLSDNEAKMKCLQPQHEFAVDSDFYFYPAPAIPPPKYNEIAEAILIDSDDDNVTANCRTDNQKQHELSANSSKKNAPGKHSTNSVNI